MAGPPAAEMSPPVPPAARPEVSLEALAALRADMLRFAQLQLRQRETAEDLVQEAIESALRHRASFAGQASVKTWVFAILRNRIIDHFRQADRCVNLSSLVEDGDGADERLEAFFTERGAWKDGPRPVSWPSPEEALHSQQFWLAFEACLTVLPEKTGRVFMMREFLGLEADEICSQLGITMNNCHVILHRARLKLRACLEAGWGRPGARRC